MVAMIALFLLSVASVRAEPAPVLSSLLDFTPQNKAELSGLAVHVDCAYGSDEEGTGSSTQPLRSIAHALKLVTENRTHGIRSARDAHHMIDVAEGLCSLSKPLQISGPGPLTIRGRGPATVLSGGQPIEGWTATKWPGAPTGSVFVANVKGWPVEIKSLRHGDELVQRARWPLLYKQGLETPNWLFTTNWSHHPKLRPGGDRRRHLHELGFHPSKLPSGVGFYDLVGAYVNMFGGTERDVLSQMTKILAISGNKTNPTLQIYSRSSFNVNQRFFLENLRAALVPGSFYFDEAAALLYYWRSPSAPPLSTAVVAPVLDRLIEVDHAQDHVLTNISFTDTTYFADGYWDGPAKEPSDAAVRINYSKNVTVSACNFLGSLGGYGVAVGNASNETFVTGSLFDSLGQGGVIAYGFDKSPVEPDGGRAAGNNTQPHSLHVSHCVMQHLGRVLAHVAGVALRAASYSSVRHTRVQHTPRYALQVDSFYPTDDPPNITSLVSRGNLLEFNVLSDTCRLTTDCAAIEMIGSGNANNVSFWNNNTIRHNNISHTQGSSSSDGKHVCVHGVPVDGCRNLVWGVYLDGEEAGINIYGNIISSSLHGAVFDNAGGNNTQVNNIFLADADSPILMNFGAPGKAVRQVSGNIVKRNIFAWSGGPPGTHQMMASMDPWSLDFLKPNGSDFNLFWSDSEDAAVGGVFPGGQSLAQWRNLGPRPTGPPLCGSIVDRGDVLQITHNCSWSWAYNQTDLRFTLRQNSTLALTLDCDGDWANCAEGRMDRTSICLGISNSSTWQPEPKPPAVDNMGWKFNPSTSALVSLATEGKCLEVCTEGGSVGGCDGKAGSRLQLANCSGAAKQRWVHDAATGALRFLGSTGATVRPAMGGQAAGGPLCITPPARPPADTFDTHSIVADPLFVDPSRGDYSLNPASPAITKLGFAPIPPIVAPTATCGGDSVSERCLARVFSRTAATPTALS